jgi:O-antigen/teichoic acid export membrane protein
MVTTLRHRGSELIMAHANKSVHTQGIVADLLGYLPSKVVPAVFAIFLLPAITRLLSPAEYGVYSIAMSTVQIMGLLTVDWIALSVIRFYPKYEEASAAAFDKTSIVLTCVVCLVSFAIMQSVSSAARLISASQFWISFGPVPLLVSLSAFFSVQMNTILAKHRRTPFSVLSIYRQCICIALGIGGALIAGGGVKTMLWVYSLALALGILVAYWFSWHPLEREAPIRWDICREMLRYGLPLVITNLFAWVLALSDRYIIGFFRGTAEVGMYSVSYTLADNSINLIVSLVVLASSPLAMKTWEKGGPSSAKPFLMRLMRVYLLLALPATVGVCLLSEPIVRLLADKAFAGGSAIVPFVASAIFIFGFQRAYQLVLLFYRKTLVVMAVLSVAGVTNILLNIVFIPRYGFIAAGVTTLLAYTIVSVAILAVSRRYLRWQFPWRSALRIALSAAVMALPVLGFARATALPLAVRVACATGAGLITYGVLLLVSGEVKLGEIRRLRLH